MGRLIISLRIFALTEPEVKLVAALKKMPLVRRRVALIC